MMRTTLNKSIEVAQQPDGFESVPPQHYTTRLPVFAALMSACLPGFGQLYNGQINKALWLFLVFCLLVAPGIAAIALLSPPAFTGYVLALGIVIAIALWLFGIVDAWRTARALQAYCLRSWQTSGMYVTVFVICNLLVLPLLIDWVRHHQVHAFRLPSASMTPSLLPGDYLFADMGYNCPSCRHQVSRGDVAIFVYPDNRTHYYIKRIIGLPGDTVSIRNGLVSVNGEALSNAGNIDPDQAVSESIDGKTWSALPGDEPFADHSVEVTPGHVFVLGDNRASSTDSRHFGMVPLSDVIGRARQIWFSAGPEGIRWARIGRVLHQSKAP